MRQPEQIYKQVPQWKRPLFVLGSTKQKREPEDEERGNEHPETRHSFLKAIILLLVVLSVFVGFMLLR